MRVEIKNDYIVSIIDLLFDMPLKGKESRHRTKFINKLEDHNKDVQKYVQQLQEEHAYKDDDGNMQTKKDGKTLQFEDPDAFNEDVKDLFDERLVIEGGDNQTTLEMVNTILEETEQEFKGRSAFVYDYLCEQFENQSKEDE